MKGPCVTKRKMCFVLVAAVLVFRVNCWAQPRELHAKPPHRIRKTRGAIVAASHLSPWGLMSPP